MSIVLLLQARGRLTADELAEELEVSIRTIYRDIDALHEAGIPLLAAAGHDGGYNLVDGHRTRLDGLTNDEAGYLFLAGLPGPAAELGHASIVAQLQRKLLAAMPDGPRQRAMELSRRFLFDAPGWFREGDRSMHLAAVARAVWDRRRITVRYRSWTGETTRTIEPYGLVLKNGTWYTAANSVDGGVRTYRVNQILELNTIDETFDVPDAFDLHDYWTAGIAEFRAQRIQGSALVRVSPTGLQMLRGCASGPVIEALDTAQGRGAGDWRTVEVPIESIDHAHTQILGLGTEIEVLEPPELRRRLATTAAGLAALYPSEPGVVTS